MRRLSERNGFELDYLCGVGGGAGAVAKVNGVPKGEWSSSRVRDDGS